MRVTKVTALWVAICLLAVALAGTLVFLWHLETVVRDARRLIARRDYRIEGDGLMTSDKRLLAEGDTCQVWAGLADPIVGGESSRAYTVDEARRRVRIYFGFDAAQLYLSDLYLMGTNPECELDADMNIVSIDIGPYYRPGIIRKYGDDAELPTMEMGRFRPSNRIHLVGPASVVSIEEKRFAFWWSGIRQPFTPTEEKKYELIDAQGNLLVFTIKVPKGARSGWLCAVTDLRPKAGGGYTGRILWSTYDGYVYIKSPGDT